MSCLTLKINPSKSGEILVAFSPIEVQIDQDFDSVINIFVIIIFIVASPSVSINIPLLTILFEKERKYKNITVHSDKCLIMSRILQPQLPFRFRKGPEQAPSLSYPIPMSFASIIPLTWGRDFQTHNESPLFPCVGATDLLTISPALY